MSSSNLKRFIYFYSYRAFMIQNMSYHVYYWKFGLYTVLYVLNWGRKHYNFKFNLSRFSTNPLPGSLHQFCTHDDTNHNILQGRCRPLPQTPLKWYKAEVFAANIYYSFYLWPSDKSAPILVQRAHLGFKRESKEKSCGL